MTDTTTPRSLKRRAGRPALVDRHQIAQAAAELGLSDLTMRAVAERLGVSVTSLYYHVRDSDDLKSLAAEYTAARLQVPVAGNQHWAEWLAEWAEYSRRAFVAEPGLLEHFLNGTLGLGNMLTNLERILEYMDRRGFSTADAISAYSLVSSCAVGAAVAEIRRDHMLAEREAWGREVQKGRLPHLAEIQDHAGELADFRDQLCTVLVGIAVRRGESPKRILALFEDS